MTALMWASRHGQVEAVRTLLAAKADVNAETGQWLNGVVFGGAI